MYLKSTRVEDPISDLCICKRILPQPSHSISLFLDGVGPLRLRTLFYDCFFKCSLTLPAWTWNHPRICRQDSRESPTSSSPVSRDSYPISWNARLWVFGEIYDPFEATPYGLRLKLLELQFPILYLDATVVSKHVNADWKHLRSDCSCHCAQL